MLFFYALLFFLFSISAVAVPIETGSRAAGPDISMPASNAADGYWILKEPEHVSKNRYSDMVLKIEHKDFGVFELDDHFQIIFDSEHAVGGHEMQFLAGIWHEVPLHASPGSHRSRELIIEQDHTKSNSITLKLASTEASKLERLPDPTIDGHLLSETCLHVANGYWVLGDATTEVPVETWRKILHVEGGKYSTFELDDKFNIISRENVDKPSPGDYFRIPFEGMDPSRRFAVLRVRGSKNRGSYIRVQYLDKLEREFWPHPPKEIQCS